MLIIVSILLMMLLLFFSDLLKGFRHRLHRPRRRRRHHREQETERTVRDVCVSPTKGDKDERVNDESEDFVHE